jgi:integrase
VVEAIRSQLPSGADPDALVFTGPGGGNHVAAGTRTVPSRHGVRRMYQTAVKRADLDHLQLRGPHDFRHTFSTWLEDAGIPARVIDELMGHQRSRHGDLDGGSRIGARYRHTTDEMAARAVDAMQARLQIVLRWPRRQAELDPTGDPSGCSRRPGAPGTVRSISTTLKAGPAGGGPMAVGP